MPIEVDLPDGSIAEFPDGTAPDVMKAALAKRFPAPRAEVSDPLYALELAKAKAGFKEVRVPPPPGIGAPATPEQAAAEGVAHQRGQEAEQAAFETTRTPGKRALGTAAFAASLPVRMATRGEYGAGDVAGLVAPGAGDAFRRAEGDFANANQAGLEAAAAAGDVMAGIPLLNTMGTVPGQVLRTGAAATRQLPGQARRLLNETEGSGPIPGAPPPAAAPTPSPVPPQAARLPNREEVFAASGRLGDDLGTKVDIPEMVAGAERKQKIAGALKSIPFAGDPIQAAYTKGLGQLETATKTAGEALGSPVGREAAGESLKQGALGWIGKNSKDHLETLYEPVYAKIDPAATRQLSSTGKLASDFLKEMKESTGTAEMGALGMIKEGVKRPEGLTVKGIARLRTEVGDKLDESIINKSPDQRALKRTYGALTHDLRAAIHTHGGDQALRAWDIANREARIVSSKSKRLAKMVGVNEDKLSAEQVFGKALAMGQEKGGNARGVALLKEVVGEKEWGNFGAQIIDHMGIDPKTALYSADRYLSEYNKLSQSAKTQYFGPAKTHLDDISTIAKKFASLGTHFNRSNTGVVNAMMKILSNPAGIVANVGTAAVNPLAALTIGGQGAFLAGGRSVAWSLARPAAAQKSANLMRAYYGAVSVSGKGAAMVVAKEEALARSIRAFSLEAARQTGSNAAEIEAEITKTLKGGG